jgi:hypothetical protein
LSMLFMLRPWTKPGMSEVNSAAVDSMAAAASL